MHRSYAESGITHTSRTGDGGDGGAGSPVTAAHREPPHMFPHRSRPSCTCSRSAAAAVVRRAVRRELSVVVHGALTEASAAVSALEHIRFRRNILH